MVFFLFAAYETRKFNLNGNNLNGIKLRFSGCEARSCSEYILFPCSLKSAD